MRRVPNICFSPFFFFFLIGGMRERYQNRSVTAKRKVVDTAVSSPCNTAQYKFANAPRVRFIIQRRHIGATILMPGALHRPLTRGEGAPF